LAGLRYWRKYQPEASGILLYQGNDASSDDHVLNFVNWKHIGEL
jgi:hypothetical protein